MRLFHCHPSALSTVLLTHQHQTAHLLLTGLGKVGGIVGRYGRHGGFVAWFHWLCVNEMIRRGMNHESPVWPLWVNIPESRRGHNIWIAPKTFVRDAQDLREKLSKGALDVRMPLAQGIMAFQREHALLSASKSLPGHILAV